MPKWAEEMDFLATDVVKKRLKNSIESLNDHLSPGNHLLIIDKPEKIHSFGPSGNIHFQLRI